MIRCDLLDGQVAVVIDICNSLHAATVDQMRPSLELFLKNYLKGVPADLDEMIHPKDEMYTGTRVQLGEDKALMTYFKLGKDLSRTIEQIVDWRFKFRRSSIKVLEFACGYGRNVRYLVHLFPRENVFVSDIYEEAVRFNQAQFGVRGMVSTHEPGDLAWDERFDLIVVPSLFSHLPASTFSPWIAALFRLLTDQGILVFSVHGDHLLPRELKMPASGIYFVPESESATLDKREYGTSTVTERYVSEQISLATGSDSYGMTRRGFWNHQDFYIISKDKRVDASTFHYDYGIIAYLDNIFPADSGDLGLSGWAKDTHQGNNENLTVRVFLDQREAGSTSTFLSRQDVAHAWGESFTQTGYEVIIPNFFNRFNIKSALVVNVISTETNECIHALPVDVSLTIPTAGSAWAGCRALAVN